MKKALALGVGSNSEKQHRKCGGRNLYYCHFSENKHQSSECQGLFSPTSEECESSQVKYQEKVNELC